MNICALKSKIKNSQSKGFSFVELMIVIVIVGILSVVSYTAIEKSRNRAMNEKMLDDLIAIANSMEDYKRDHNMKYPVPEPGDNQNVLCYYADATYAHSCDPAEGAVFRQGMIDNNLLSKRYLRDVPTDPRTGSRYVYGVTNDGKYFQVAGVYKNDEGEYESRTAENLGHGFELPSIIRAYDSANFVVDKEKYLPYSPNHLVLTGTLDNIIGIVKVNDEMVKNGKIVSQGDTITASAGSGADIYFSDGSITIIDPNSSITLTNLEVAKNDKDGSITKILLKLNAGKIWSKVVRLAQNSEFKVETTGAIAGVRGTECGFEVDSSGIIKEVVCLSGGVKITTDEGLEKTIDNVLPASPKKIVFENGKPKPVEDADSYEISEIYKEYYKNIPLSSYMRPHIISIKADAASPGTGIITVRNVNYFTEKVNNHLKLSGDSARRVMANRLAVHKLEKSTDEGGEIEFSQRIEIDPDNLTEPYEITVALNESYILRFEYWKGLSEIQNNDKCQEEGGEWNSKLECDKLINKSLFSLPPVQISEGSDMTEEDLYPNLFKTEKPTLTLSAPSYVALRQLQTGSYESADFTINAELKNADEEYYVMVTSSDSTICSKITYETQHTSSQFTISAKADSIGTCKITVNATLSQSGDSITADIAIQIVEESAKLILSSPEYGASFVAGGNVTLQWLAPGASSSQAYSVEVKLDGTAIANSPFNTANTYYELKNITGGNYTWSVSMTDSQKNTYTSETRSFTVTEPITVNFYITTIAPVFINWNTNTQGSIVKPAGTDEIEMTISADDTGQTNYAYDWSLSNFSHTLKNPKDVSNFDAKIDVSKLAAGESMYSSISLTLRDDKGNVAGSKTKGITVYNYPELTSAEFYPSTINYDTYPLQFSIPDLAYVSPDIAPIPASSCTHLRDGADVVITDPSSYTLPSKGDTLTCVIKTGTIIKGHIAASDITAVLEITIGEQVCGDEVVNEGEDCDDGNTTSGDGCSATCQVESGWSCSGSPSFCTQSGPTITSPPTSVDLGDTAAFVATGDCIWSVTPAGSGSISPITASPSAIYNSGGNEAVRFATKNTEQVTIACTDPQSPNNTDTASITVNYKPADVSPSSPNGSGYTYSYAYAANQSWTQADTFCKTLAEGGFNWGLPEKDPMSIQPSGENQYWCNWVSPECTKMSPAYSMWLKDLFGVDKAYVINGFSNSIQTELKTGLRGVRCVK